MTARERALLEEADLRAMVEGALKRGPVMAPRRRGQNALAFDWIEAPEEVELRYVRTILPPKRAMFPEREALLEFQRAPQQEARPVTSEQAYVLLGVHPCDLAAIGQLDWAMGRRHDVVDPNYVARRGAATIVGVECLPDEYCFCTSVGTCDTREGADLFLTPVESGYVAEALTEKGGELLAAAGGGRRARAEEVAEAEGWSERKSGETTCRIGAGVEGIAELLEGGYDSEIWEETARRCYGCGTCTNVCPTCFCFDVTDCLELTMESGTRCREYDSCQVPEFAVVAGGHNFREERSDRVRHRWFRKFVRLLRESGRPFCVGCGRCSQACTAGISLTDVLDAVIAEGKARAA